MYTDGQGHVHTAIEALGESSTAVIDGSVMLTVGGSSIALNGMTLTLAPSGFVVDGPAPTNAPLSDAPVEGVIYTDGFGHTHAATEAIGDDRTAVIDGSITLTVGGHATVVSGEIISLASNDLIVDGTTESFSTTDLSSNGPTGAVSTLAGGYFCDRYGRCTSKCYLPGGNIQILAVLGVCIICNLNTDVDCLDMIPNGVYTGFICSAVAGCYTTQFRR